MQVMRAMITNNRTALAPLYIKLEKIKSPEKGMGILR